MCCVYVLCVCCLCLGGTMRSFRPLSNDCLDTVTCASFTAVIYNSCTGKLLCTDLDTKLASISSGQGAMSSAATRAGCRCHARCFRVRRRDARAVHMPGRYAHLHGARAARRAHARRDGRRPGAARQRGDIPGPPNLMSTVVVPSPVCDANHSCAVACVPFLWQHPK